MDEPAVQYMTIGAIATRVQAPTHRVNYVLKTRGIAPIGRAGRSRVWSEDVIAKVREELRKCEAFASGMRSN
jgi:hypothetical protein